MIIQLTDTEAMNLSAFLQNIQDSMKKDLIINSAFHQKFIVGVIDQFVEQVNMKIDDEKIEAIIHEMTELENRYNEAKNN